MWIISKSNNRTIKTDFFFRTTKIEDHETIHLSNTNRLQISNSWISLKRKKV